MLRLTVHLLIIGILGAGPLRADPGEAVVKRWLATNEGVDTLRIEFTQTRKLTSLKSATRQRGVLWLVLFTEQAFVRWR